ncbi:predicted protein, partial [Nematostella vectensis]
MAKSSQISLAEFQATQTKHSTLTSQRSLGKNHKSATKKEKSRDATDDAFFNKLLKVLSLANGNAGNIGKANSTSPVKGLKGVLEKIKQARKASKKKRARARKKHNKTSKKSKHVSKKPLDISSPEYMQKLLAKILPSVVNSVKADMQQEKSDQVTTTPKPSTTTTSPTKTTPTTTPPTTTPSTTTTSTTTKQTSKDASLESELKDILPILLEKAHLKKKAKQITAPKPTTRPTIKPTTKSRSSEIKELLMKLGISGLVGDNVKTTKPTRAIESEAQTTTSESTLGGVHSVFPSSGSFAGGTLLTIQGQGFGRNSIRVEVDIAGVKCNVASVTDTEIKCTTNSHVQNKPLYAGIRRQIWLSHYVTCGYYTTSYLTKVANCPSFTRSWTNWDSQKSDDFNLKKGQEVYLLAHHVDTGGSGHGIDIGVKVRDVKHPSSKLGGATKEVQQLYTWSNVVPEKQCDDKAELYLSLNGDPANKTKVANCPSFTRSWTKWDSQKSDDFNLKKGQEVYLLAHHVDTGGSGHGIDIGVKVRDVKHPSSKLGGATKEVQQLYTWSNVVPETLVGIRKEVAKRLLAFVGDMELSLTLNLTKAAASFNIQIGDKTSASIETSVTEEALQDAFIDMFSAKCTGSVYGSGACASGIGNLGTKCWYHEGFERWPEYGHEGGTKTNDSMPFCGRTSIENPHLVYHTGTTKKSSIDYVSRYELDIYPYLCFAYKGPIREYIQMRLDYTRESGRNGLVYYPWMKFERGTISNNWKHVCINILEIVIAANPPDALSLNKYHVDWIKVFREPKTSDTFYMDELWIGKEKNTMTPSSAPAMPGGHLVRSFKVEQVADKVFKTFLTPAKCGTNIPLIGIQNGVTQSSTSNQKVIQLSGGLASSYVTVERTAPASPPITGTFNITCSGKTSIGLPANAEADYVKERLEETCPEEGLLTVYRWGRCAAYTWHIEWNTVGGDRPQLTVSGDLQGQSVSIGQRTITEGNYFMKPIPSEFLRLPCEKSQVFVKSWGIPSAGNCSESLFEFTSEATPTLTSVSPTNISAGNELTLTGTGFSTDCSKNSVLIGSTNCSVTTCSETEIKCTVEFGLGYGWSPKLVLITQGDPVKWKWSTQAFSNIQYQVCSSNEATPAVCDGNVFKSMRSKIGTFSHKFSRTGAYSYTSGPVDVNENIIMNGKVEVDEFVSEEQPIKLTVEGYSAICAASRQAAASSTSCSSGVTTAISGCDTGSFMAVSAVSGSCLTFQYRKCHTPIVTSVSPNNGTSQDVITITGSGFSVTQCQNNVKFGDHVCNIVSNTETKITCKLDVSKTPAPGIELPVEVTVTNRGHAFVHPVTGTKASFVLYPRVASISPTSGSEQGGTRLTVTGDGFATDAK